MMEELSCVFTNVDVSRYFAFEINPLHNNEWSGWCDESDNKNQWAHYYWQPHAYTAWAELARERSEEVIRNWMMNDDFRK